MIYNIINQHKYQTFLSNRPSKNAINFIMVFNIAIKKVWSIKYNRIDSCDAAELVKVIQMVLWVLKWLLYQEKRTYSSIKTSLIVIKQNKRILRIWLPKLSRLNPLWQWNHHVSREPSVSKNNTIRQIKYSKGKRSAPFLKKKKSLNMRWDRSIGQI